MGGAKQQRKPLFCMWSSSRQLRCKSNLRSEPNAGPPTEMGTKNCRKNIPHRHIDIYILAILHLPFAEDTTSFDCQGQLLSATRLACMEILSDWKEHHHCLTIQTTSSQLCGDVLRSLSGTINVTVRPTRTRNLFCRSARTFWVK